MSLSKKPNENLLRHKVEQRMRECVRNGVWCSGMIIPSRRALAKEFDVDLNTLQRAIAPLLADGTLRADTGRATYVNTRLPAEILPKLSVGAVGEARPRATFKGARIGIVAALSIRFTRYTDAENVYAMIGSMERILAGHGIATTVADITELGRRDVTQAACMRSLMDLGVDGLIVMAGASPEACTLAKSIPLPVVFLGSETIRERVAYIHPDNYDAGYQAAEHLIEKGCERLLFFASRTTHWGALRLEGVEGAVKVAGSRVTLHSEIGEGTLPRHDFDQTRDAYDMAIRLVKRGDAFDGVIGANDNFARGYLQAAQERGLDAPDDFLLVGFDDDRHTASKAGLTSIRWPEEQMASHAAAILLEGLAGEQVARHTALFAQIIPRNSTYRRSADRAEAAAPALVGDFTGG
jgi:DNA-binding LacI/PurR family transcriptional regulator